MDVFFCCCLLVHGPFILLGGGGRDRNCRVKGLEQRRQILIRLNQAKKKHFKSKGLECIMSKFSHTFVVNVLIAFESLHLFYTL